jgi:hypothetical protein
MIPFDDPDIVMLPCAAIADLNRETPDTPETIVLCPPLLFARRPRTTTE